MSSTRPRARIAVLLLSAVLVVSGPALAVDPNRALTQYVHRIWQVPQGLPQATVYAILQDSDGYLWLGTQGGLVRFDGVRFATIDAPALAGAWIQSLAEDRHGNLWVGTRDHGLVRLQGDAISRVAVGGNADNARTLLVDREDGVWVAAANGAVIIRIASGKAQAHPAGVVGRPIEAACQAEDGTVWFGGAGSELGIWNGAGFARYHLTVVPRSTAVHAMLRASDGSILIGTSNGLVRISGANQRLLTVADGLADNDVLALAESREGGVWAGTRNGFTRIRPADVESFRSEDGLSQSTVYALCEDREGSFWVGTKHGLNQFFDGRTIPYTTKEGLPSNDTGPVLQDGSGTAWVGTLDAGLGRYDGHRFTTIGTGEGLPSNTIRALARDGAGHVWVGTDRGLCHLRDGRVDRVYTTAHGMPDNQVRALAVDGAGAIWIGTSRGLAVLRDGRIESPPPGLPRSATVTALAIAPDGHLEAVANSGGVYVFGGGRWREQMAHGASIAGVDALYAAPDGRLWMGTDGKGLWLVSGDQVVSYSMHDGLFDDEIYGIAADGAGRLWMACSKGIFSVVRADLLKYAAGEVRSFVSTPYSPTDALRTIECRPLVQPGVWPMQDGRVWFSTIRGVIVIDPNHLDRRLPAPRVLVEEITANGQRERDAALRHLPPGDRNVAFVYTALSFVAPTRITFRYILEGFDRDWTAAGVRREAFYTNLPPGQFRFRVLACNVDGNCAETAHPVAFAIAPHVYQRWWFFPVCAAFAALVVWFAYRMRVRRLREQFAIVLAERNRIARELHDTLIQGFAGIAMELQALAARLSPSPERTTLDEIIRDAGWSLRETRRSLAGLRSVQGGASNLGIAIARTASQIIVGRGIRLKLKVDDDLPDVPANTAYNVQRIAQEAVANAAKHSGASTIEVGLHATPSGLELYVTDDGSGFEAEGTRLVEGGHYGLVGMRERAEEMGAGFQVASTRGKGTKIIVTVPLTHRTEPGQPHAVAG